MNIPLLLTRGLPSANESANESEKIMPRVRVHQHVNPLAPYFRFTPPPLEIEKIFADSTLPLHLDIGAGRGRFLLKMAEVENEKNFLGLEIREPLADEANRLAAEKNFLNLHYEFCNAMLNLDKLLENLPADILQTVTIQFPDPWYKKKHAKRRMIKENVVETLAAHMISGGEIFIQTDVEFLFEEMRELFRQNGNFSETVITENPFAVKTERESAVESNQLPVFRTLFVKNLIKKKENFR